MKRMTFLLLVGSIILVQAGPQAGIGMARGGAQDASSHKPTLKEKVIEIPPQTIVEVTLKDKEKIRGRLGEISNEAFTVKVASGDTLQDRQIAFKDVKSMKKFEGNKALKVVGYSALAAGVAIGTAILVVVIIVAVAA